MGYKYKNNAEDRNRTGTVITHRRILSPVRLPVPPPRRNELAKRRTGFEPATPTLAGGALPLSYFRKMVPAKGLEPSTL